MGPVPDEVDGLGLFLSLTLELLELLLYQRLLPLHLLTAVAALPERQVNGVIPRLV